MDTILHDLRYALRVLPRNPGFTAIAILTLALGMGANTAIFSVVNAVLLRPLSFRDPARLVIVAEKSPYPVISTSYQNWMDWRDQNHSFESLEAVRFATITLTGAGEPERLNVHMATAGLFPLLGVNTIAGRTFTAGEDGAGGAPVVLLSYGLWQRRFGAARDILGKPINLDSQPYTVVGVLYNKGLSASFWDATLFEFANEEKHFPLDGVPIYERHAYPQLTADSRTLSDYFCRPGQRPRPAENRQSVHQSRRRI
jgi:putative ABC transport system permease protein